jgi:hypothetical protein
MNSLQPPLRETKSDHQLKGLSRQHIQQSPNLSTGRVPIFFGMEGQGKANWALRGGQRPVKNKYSNNGKEVLDPFQDWLKAVAGPQRSLGAQVQESEEQMNKLRGDLGDKSRLFKNFWLKEEVEPEHLFEDRIRYTALGIQTFNKAAKKYPKPDYHKVGQPPEGRPPLSDLFHHYGVTHGKKGDSDPGLKSLSSLMQKSAASLDRAQGKGPEKRTASKLAAAGADLKNQFKMMGGMFGK